MDKVSTYVIDPILALLFAAGLLLFAVGVVEFMLGLNTDGSENAKEKGRMHMLYGVLGMFIMAAAYAIIVIIGQTEGATLPYTVH